MYFVNFVLCKLMENIEEETDLAKQGKHSQCGAVFGENWRCPKDVRENGETGFNGSGGKSWVKHVK